MKHIKILFYATVREVTGISEFEIDLPDESTVIDLKTFLAERFPKITRAFPTIIAAVNQECVRDDYQLPHNSEIAFSPQSAEEIVRKEYQDKFNEYCLL